MTTYPEDPPTGREVSAWADEAMFKAEPHKELTPRVYLVAMNADPLGQIAACAKMYKGEVVRGLIDVSYEERRYYLEQMQLTKLKMPLEAVTFHFMLDNVTRAFTHQLVRQRTAAYAQESMRFAVVEDLPNAVGYPPSLAGTVPLAEWLNTMKFDRDSDLAINNYIERYASDQQKMRFIWDRNIETTGRDYMTLVNLGMPAEDARGLMPTNILTRVNYITNLRGLLDHAGNRLCTQAQMEWRLVFAQIAQAIREYDKSSSEGWQFLELSKLLQPVCYQIGHCAFMADFDRKCSIRERVQANAAIGRASGDWSEPYDPMPHGGTAPVVEWDPAKDGKPSVPVFIGPIRTEEWLTDPGAAR